MDKTQETIAAIATASGRSGVGIVRVSGPLVNEIALAVCGKKIESREATYSTFINDGDTIDHGIVVQYSAPASYTGEDVLELQAHGSPIVLSAILDACVVHGARLARPGEFTERAFLNGKLDLAQAEAVIDLIDARTRAAARAATRSLQGEFSDRAQNLVEQLIAIRVYIEAALDFSEEEVDFLEDKALHERIKTMQESLQETIRYAEQGRLLKEGVTLVISGAPNVGKSSLLNRLTGFESAIITDIAGTTRDVLREHINIDGLPVNIIDTAGLRDSNDPIEQEGIRRARLEIEKADHVLYVCESDTENALSDDTLNGIPYDVVINKIDLHNETAKIEFVENTARIFISAKTGEGIQLLKDHIKKISGFTELSESTFIARQRHLDALARANSAIKSGLQNLSQKAYPELAAEDFNLAQHAFQEITGDYTSDDLLGEIFSNFCIGK